MGNMHIVHIIDLYKEIWVESFSAENWVAIRMAEVKRFHQDMQSAGIYNVGLGLPHIKTPTTHQNCLKTNTITSRNVIISLLYIRISMFFFFLTRFSRRDCLNSFFNKFRVNLQQPRAFELTLEQILTLNPEFASSQMRFKGN